MSEEATATREVSSSVEITQDATGKLKFVVKVYCEAGLEEAAATQASLVLKQLRREYGL